MTDSIDQPGDGKRVSILSLEGNIAAGKSTQMKRLEAEFAHDPTVIFVPEPVQEWSKHGLLRDMYDGTMDKATFQMAVIMSLTVPLISAMHKPGVRLVISERSPSSNALTFAELNLDTRAMRTYNYVFGKAMHELSNADIYMAYLKLPVEQAVERVNRRAREGEAGFISSEYMCAIHDKHESLTSRVANLKGEITVDASRAEDAVFASLHAYVMQLLPSRAD